MKTTYSKISKPYTVIGFSEFGEIDNPIWHLEMPIEILKAEDFNAKILHAIEGHVLIPFEKTSAPILDRLHELDATARRKVTLQMGIAQLDSLNVDWPADIPCQVWVDRILEPQLLNKLQALKNKIEIVLIPLRTLNLELIVQNLSDHTNIPTSYLFLPKVNPFCGLLEIHELLPQYKELSDLVPQRKLSPVTLLNCLHQMHPIIQSFCLFPISENFEAYLKAKSSIQFNLFKTAKKTSIFMPFNVLIFILKSVRHPFLFIKQLEGAVYKYGVKTYWFSHKNLNQSYWSIHKDTSKVYLFFIKTYWFLFNLTGRIYVLFIKTFWLIRNLYHPIRHSLIMIFRTVFYPLYKIYWFLKFQYEKRILKVRR